MQKSYVAIGRIVRAVGLKGEVLVKAYSQLDSLLQPGCFYLLKKDSQPERYVCLRILRARPKGKNQIVCSLEGIEDRTAAEGLEKSLIYQRTDLLPSTDQDEYYWYQLKGLDVYTVDGERLGKVEAVLETGASDVLVVRDPKGEILIPMVEGIIQEVQLEEGRCVVDLPPGLQEATFTSSDKVKRKKKKKK